MWQTKLGANAPGATNPLIIHAYTFIPKKLDRSHGGVHANFDSSGREVDDVFAGCRFGKCGDRLEFSRTQVVETTRSANAKFRACHHFCRRPHFRHRLLGEHDFLDSKRVGILGWSGVPVSDLVARMGYESEGYRQQYSAPYHIGKTVHVPGELPASGEVRSRLKKSEGHRLPDGRGSERGCVLA